MTKPSLKSSSNRIISPILTLMLLISGVGAATFWLHVPNVKAASSLPYSNNDVLFIHGFNKDQPQKVDCAGTFSPMIRSIVAQSGWSSTQFHTVGFYSSDTNCDISLFHNDPDQCSLWYSAANEGTDNEDLVYLACKFANFIYDNYTSRGKGVDIVAHSMGGIITRLAIHDLGANGFPPSLDVNLVAMIATPNGGVPGGIIGVVGTFFQCGCQQATEMEQGSSFMTPLTNEKAPPVASSSWQTDWLSISSVCDSFLQAGDPGIDYTTAMQFPGGQKILYAGLIGSTAGHIVSCGDSKEYNGLPSYTHGGYLQEQQTSGTVVGGKAAVAEAYSCLGCSDTPDKVSNVAATDFPNEVLDASIINEAFKHPTPLAPAGYLSNAGGSMVSGWACDNANASETSKVDFYANAPYGQTGTVYLGEVSAGINRPDLVSAGVCGSSPNHGFQFDAGVAGNGYHKIWAYNIDSGNSYVIGNSGTIAVSIGAPYPVGYFQNQYGSLLTGWACDDTNVTNISDVDFYADGAYNNGGRYIGSAHAGDTHPDLVAAGVCGSTPNHGFTFDAKNAGSGQHKIWAYNQVSGTVTLLGNSGNVIDNGIPPVPAGNLEGADRLTITGWACDNAFGAATSKVDIYINAPYNQPGTDYLGEVKADINRPDLASAGVCGGTPNHGFQFKAAFGNAPQTYTVWAYNIVSGTVTTLPNSGNVTITTIGCKPPQCE